MDFTNKVALVTGAAVGIGRATAILLAQNGAKLVLVDINGEKLEALKAELAEYGVKILTFVCDVSDEQAVNKVAEESLKAFGKIDILVNNAVLWRSKSSFLNTPTEEWKKYIDINVMGTIYFTKALAKEVTDKGVLVNSVSPGSVSPSDNYDIDHTQESTLSFMGRTGSDRENANLICFLASDAASYISGQNIQIDGCRKKQ